jgi:3,4-dihydroxy 2-butanone 4-phosphate synthase/GTP cyclohydrolase II
VGAQILSDLGVHRLRLITNNPRKIAGLGGYGLAVVDRVPLVMDPGTHNAAYLQAKRLKLGHLMEASPVGADGTGPHGLSAVLAWCGEADSRSAAERIEALRRWAAKRDLRLEQEDHPRLLALLDQPRLALLLTAAPDQQLTAADLAGPLMVMARWDNTQSVGLLLTPDVRRRSHPSVDLEPEARPLGDLQDSTNPASCPLLNLTPGAFIRWRA